MMTGGKTEIGAKECLSWKCSSIHDDVDLTLCLKTEIAAGGCCQEDGGSARRVGTEGRTGGSDDAGESDNPGGSDKVIPFNFHA